MAPPPLSPVPYLAAGSPEAKVLSATTTGRACLRPRRTRRRAAREAGRPDQWSRRRIRNLRRDRSRRTRHRRHGHRPDHNQSRGTAGTPGGDDRCPHRNPNQSQSPYRRLRRPRSPCRRRHSRYPGPLPDFPAPAEYPRVFAATRAERGDLGPSGGKVVSAVAVCAGPGGSGLAPRFDGPDDWLARGARSGSRKPDSGCPPHACAAGAYAPGATDSGKPGGHGHVMRWVGNRGPFACPRGNYVPTGICRFGMILAR